MAAATQPDEILAADLTRFAERESARQSWQSAAAHLVSASRLSPEPAAAQRRVLQAVVWTMLRGDAATAAELGGEIAGYPPGPLRDGVLGSLAIAGDDPAAAAELLASGWQRSIGTDDAEAAATVALMTAIHWYGRLNAQATVHWCERTLAAISAASTSATSLYAVAVTYLVHGLGYAGRTAESVAAAAAAREQPGDEDHLG